MTRRLHAVAIALAIVLPAAAHADDTTLYAQLGGRAGVTALMRDALEITAHGRVNAEQFRGVDLDALSVSLHEQVCALTGGGCVYQGKSMAAAHKGLHVTTAQFNALVEDLQTAMDRRGIPFATQNRLLALLAPMHRDIVQR